RVCRVEGRKSESGRSRRALPVQHRALQAAQGLSFRGQPAEEQLREGAEDGAAQAPIIPATMSRRAVILVADDSEDIRNLFGIMLQKNYDVKFAVNSDETLAGADTDPLPDLILLDVEMPELNGYEVCARLKANPALSHIPVIFVSARSDPKDQAKGLLVGAVDYITKPISAPIAMLRV